QRAQLSAILPAQEQALQIYRVLTGAPRFIVRIFSDSTHVIMCMERIPVWIRRGWKNTDGGQLGNRDLIEQAPNMNDRLKRLGYVSYTKVDECEIADAMTVCEDRLD
ncbi:hypothetical protein EJ08DRAFT_558684, partial [Tothia fuscella]